jgi:hypothetical protein
MQLKRSDLYDYGESLNVEDSFLIFEHLDVDQYAHGRCQLMALVLADQGMDVGVFIDDEAHITGAGEPVAALQHAFCRVPGDPARLIDARGVRGKSDLYSEYCLDAYAPSYLAGDEAAQLLRDWISQGLLEDFVPGEREALRLYVNQMRTLKLFEPKAPEPEREYSDSMSRAM